MGKRRRKKNQDLEAAHLSEHTPEAIRSRLDSGPATSYLRDFIYGGIDGAVTTFAIVSGVAGAGLSSGVVVVLGIANLVGDGFSMAVGNFLGTRADQQMRELARRTEKDHIARYPEGEREEIRQIFSAKGFSGDDLERVVEVITSNRGRWIDTMLREEWGLSLEGPSPVRAALTTFAAFIGIGLIPLLSFLATLVWPERITRPFLWSSILTAAAFFLVGILKSRIVKKRWILEGLETLGVGSCAAALAFGIGYALRGLIH